MSKYLNEEGLKAVWKKTKEKIAESCAEVEAKVDAIEDLTDEELNTILADTTFIIGGTVYQFEEGMTWEDWCASEYNLNNEWQPYEGGDGNYVQTSTGGNGFVYSVQYGFEEPTDVIRANFEYDKYSN